MIPDLKDNRLVCNLRGGNLEVDSVVVGWVGRALHLVASLHLLIKVVICGKPDSLKNSLH